jgi:hypothetical protein
MPGRPRFSLGKSLFLVAAAMGAIAPLPRASQAEDYKVEAPAAIEKVEIEARPIAHFQRARPDAKRFGALEFRGGLVLTSRSRHFGGWSGLAMAPDGKSLLAISDIGVWMTADLAYDGTRPAKLVHAELGPLRGTGGRPLRNKREQDAEALALVDGTLARGTVLIGFERVHRIGRFEIRDRKVRAPAGYLRLPAEAFRMQPNQGIEALAVLQGGPHKGSVVAFAERFTRGSGYHTGWMWVKGEPRAIHLKDIDRFNITDAAGLPDGSLLVLERYFRWTEGVKMRIRHLAAAEIVPGARLTGRTLIEADSAFEIDNMEGMAVHRGPRGETVVTLVSDDNFNSLLQRTVLLQFTLVLE